MSTQNRIADRPRATQRHPLDPLAADEYARVVAALRAHADLGDPTRFVNITLSEPSQRSVMELGAGVVPPEREASAVLLGAGGVVHEATVQLSGDKGEVTRLRAVEGVQASVTPEECAECEQVVRADPTFREALKLRGITDLRLVHVESWGVGDFVRGEDAGRRLVWCPCWIRSHEGDNAYAHPIEGVYPIVDLNEMRVVRVEDHGVISIPTESGDFRAEVMPAMRDDVRPLDIVQSAGPSFEVDGWQVRWQRWRLRVGFTQREGLVLHTLGYEDGGRVRPILHRASIAELFVPYGDPSPGTYRKNAFDLGEYGAGPLTNSLELGCDCLGDITYFDVDLCNSTGEPYTIRNAICMHEEDYGLLWKHSDTETGGVEARRSRRLVISSILTADNYDYGFYWYFYQDGSLEFEAKLTGIVLTSAVDKGALTPYGRLVAPNLVAPNHQHFFCARLDMCVDGIENTIEELHTETAPAGHDNPYRNGFVSIATKLTHEHESRQQIDPLTARRWRVVNPSKRNRFGDPVGYQLIPGANCRPYAAEDSSVRRRAGFINHHLWVTPFHPNERYPSGEYPNQHPGGAGLPEWTRANRSIENTNLVVWYTFGSNHISRPEEWPVMSIERVGFAMRPDGFFDANPSLDVPPPDDHNHCASSHDDANEEPANQGH